MHMKAKAIANNLLSDAINQNLHSADQIAL
jgi:hypothetical protein